ASSLSCRPHGETVDYLLRPLGEIDHSWSHVSGLPGAAKPLGHRWPPACGKGTRSISGNRDRVERWRVAGRAPSWRLPLAPLFGLVALRSSNGSAVIRCRSEPATDSVCKGAKIGSC